MKLTTRWRKDEIEMAIALRDEGIPCSEIGRRLGRSGGAVSKVFGRVSGHALDEYVRKREPKKQVFQAPEANGCDPREACLAHWYDLAAHHPSGWGSYRIDSEFRSQVRGYVASHVSLVGSSAAVCAGV